tara:strand:- start:11679 stop:12986 length:1308 start_codon:yes stop_codon:yes gene_type:complete
MSGDENLTKKYGPWISNKPQNEMHKQYQLLNDTSLRYIAEDNPYVDKSGNKIAARKYWLMDVNAIYNIMKHNLKLRIPNCYYELMPSSQCTHGCNSISCTNMIKYMGTRAYLDVEFKEPCDWQDYLISAMVPKEVGKTIAESFKKHIESYLNCTCELIILKSHRSNKWSWHFIAKCFRDGVEYLFNDSLAVMTLIENWDEIGNFHIFDYEEDGLVKNAIDTSVYSTHKLFRIYGNQKKTTASGILEFACYYPLKDAPKPDFKDMFVIQPYETDNIKRLKFDIVSSESTTKLKRQRVDPAKHPAKKTTNKRPRVMVSHNHLALEQFYFGLPVWKKIKEHLQKRFPFIDFNATHFKSVDSVYLPLKSTMCPFNNGSKGGAHKTNHSYLYIYLSSGCCYWFCQDVSCTGKKCIDFPIELRMEMRRMYQKKKEITILLD